MTATTIPVIAVDRAKNVRMRFRKGEGATVTFHFILDSNSYDISPWAFLMQVFEIDGTTPIFELTEGDGLVNNGVTGQLVATISDSDVDLATKSYAWKLKIITPFKFTCFNALFAVNDSPIMDDEDNIDITVPLSFGDDVVNVNLTLSGGGADLSNLTYEQVIAFYVTMLPFIGAEQLYTSLLPLIQGESSTNAILTELYQNLIPFINGEPDDGSDEYYIYTQLIPYMNP